MLLHRNIVANMLQARAWMQPASLEQPTAARLIITPLPLYHIFALTANCLVFMRIGGENILIPNPRDIPGFVKELAKYKFTAFPAVNTLFNALLNNADFGKLDFSRCKIYAGRRHGGAGGGGREVEAGHRRAADRGLRPDRNVARGDDAIRSTCRPTPASIGLPIPSTEIVAARRRRQRSAARPARRDLHPRARR